MAFPGDVYAADCSARDALALISGKWVMLLLPALAEARNAMVRCCGRSKASRRRC